MSGWAWRREQAVALQIAVGAVVADHVERVARRLERAAGALAPVAALAGVGRQDPLAIGGRQLGDPRAHLGQVAPGGRPERVGHHPLLAVRVEVDQPHRGAGRRRLGRPEQLGAERRGRPLGRPQVGRVRAAAVGPVDAGEEVRDHLAQLDQHPAGALARLGQRVPEHPHQHRLVGLARGEDPDVGRGRRRQQPAQRVERARPHGPRPRPVVLGGVARGGLGHPRLHPRQQLGVGRRRRRRASPRSAGPARGAPPPRRGRW